MHTDSETTTGPSARAVQLARVWLLVLASSSILAGVATYLTGGVESWELIAAFIGVGLVLALAARRASARLAVFICSSHCWVGEVRTVSVPVKQRSRGGVVAAAHVER